MQKLLGFGSFCIKVAGFDILLLELFGSQAINLRLVRRQNHLLLVDHAVIVLGTEAIGKEIQLSGNHKFCVKSLQKTLGFFMMVAVSGLNPLRFPYSQSLTVLIE